MSNLRELTAHDLSTLDWAELGGGMVRIVADLTCAGCGAYQAADSDPTTEKALAAALAVRLFHDAGWRLDARGRPICPECVDVASRSAHGGLR